MGPSSAKWFVLFFTEHLWMFSGAVNIRLFGEIAVAMAASSYSTLILLLWQKTTCIYGRQLKFCYVDLIKQKLNLTLLELIRDNELYLL